MGEMYVSLREICDEKRTVTDAETNKTSARPVYFESMPALIEGAFEFVCLFDKMHREGKIYGSNRSDLFLFDLETGQMKFEGQQFVIPEGQESEQEKATVISEFLAPEILQMGMDGRTYYSMETDWYFLSVFLFEYFFHTGSPFEGKKMVNRCFLSPLEKETFRAEEGVFCMDPIDDSNEPVKGIQDKLIQYWGEYPEILQKTFQKAFMDGGNLINLRPNDLDWKNVLIKLSMNYIQCSCGFHGYSDKLIRQDDGTYICPKCKRTYYPLSNGMDTILLADGVKLYECQTGKDQFDKDTVTGIVIENKQHKGLYGIKNLSDGYWTGLFPGGKRKEISKGSAIPIWEDMQIAFEVGEDWSLKIMPGSRAVQTDDDTVIEDMTETAVAEIAAEPPVSGKDENHE